MYKCEWERHWVDAHSETITDFITGTLCPLVILDKSKIDVITDLGCGHRPRSDLLNRILKPKYRILIDVGMPPYKDGKIIGNSLHIKGNIEELFKETKCYEQKRRIAKFIGLGDINPNYMERKLEGQINIALFSDILNYVDYKLVLDTIDRYIAKGGRMVILNKPGRGYDEFFSEKGVKSNHELLDHIRSKGIYTMERCLDATRSRPSYGPWREIGCLDYEDDNTWILLIAKKV